MQLLAASGMTGWAHYSKWCLERNVLKTKKATCGNTDKTIHNHTKMWLIYFDYLLSLHFWMFSQNTCGPHFQAYSM